LINKSPYNLKIQARDYIHLVISTHFPDRNYSHLDKQEFYPDSRQVNEVAFRRATARLLIGFLSIFIYPFKNGYLQFLPKSCKPLFGSLVTIKLAWLLGILLPPCLSFSDRQIKTSRFQL